MHNVRICLNYVMSIVSCLGVVTSKCAVFIFCPAEQSKAAKSQTTKKRRQEQKQPEDDDDDDDAVLAHLKDCQDMQVIVPVMTRPLDGSGPVTKKLVCFGRGCKSCFVLRHC